MALKRTETSKQRLQEKTEEGKKYLEDEKNNYVINELRRLRKNLEKKKLQFEKDFEAYKLTEDKDEDKVIEYENTQIEADDVIDDLEHYQVVTEEQKQDEEKRIQIEMELERRKQEQEQQLEMRRQDQQFEIEKLRIESDIEKEKFKSETTIATLERKFAAKQQTARLPKLELSKFNGQVLKWQAFWDSFQSTIHKNDSLNKIDKLNYLRSQLEGEALKSITGLELTEANYDVAIDILKERYGNVQLIIENHYSKLSDLSPASHKTTILRRVFDTIEQHLRCLETLGEDIDHKHYVTLIKRKFPVPVIRHIEQQKDIDENWTVKKLRNELRKYIMTNEIAELQQPHEIYNDFDLMILIQQTEQ